MSGWDFPLIKRILSERERHQYQLLGRYDIEDIFKLNVSGDLKETIVRLEQRFISLMRESDIQKPEIVVLSIRKAVRDIVLILQTWAPSFNFDELFAEIYLDVLMSVANKIIALWKRR